MSQQIPRMSIIYYRAAETIVWLGKDNEEQQARHLRNTFKALETYRSRTRRDTKKTTHKYLLFDLMRMWLEDGDLPRIVYANYRRLLDKTKRLPEFQRRLATLSSRVEDRAADITELKISFLRAVEHMARRPYWRRVWIAQELSAAGEIEFWCGDDISLDFDMFTQIATELDSLRVFPPTNLGFSHLLNLISMRAKYQGGEPIYLFEALRDTYRAECRQKHDEIYALLGISWNSSRFVPAIDKSLEIGSVVRSMTESYIRSSKSLDIICVQDKKMYNPLELPSWAPDWRLIGRDPFNNRMLDYLTGNDDHPKINTRAKYWTATSNSRCKSVIIEEGCLYVRGKPIATISTLSQAADLDAPIVPRRAGDESTMQGLIDTAIATSRDALEWQNPVNLHLAIFEIMTIYKEKSTLDDRRGDWDAAFHLNGDKKLFENLKKDQPHVYEWLERHRSFRIGGVTLLDWSRSMQGEFLDRFGHLLKAGLSRWANDQPLDIRRSQIRAAVWRVVADGLRLMTTSTPSTGWASIGWAHPRAKVGGEIFLLEGCSMPVILRREFVPDLKRELFTVIGDAYLHGVMYGELWDGQEDGLDTILLH